MQSGDSGARCAAARAAVLLALLLCASPADAQTGVTVRVIRSAPVLQTPRGDGMVVGLLEVGTVLEVRGRQGVWLQVDPPAGTSVEWARGWVHTRDIEVASGSLAPSSQVTSRAVRPPGRRSIRGFVQAGGALFAARNSFETIVGSRFGPSFGAGGQFGFASGAFFQLGVSRFEETGSRAIVTAGQIFRLDVPHTVTVMPIELTAGYRRTHASRLASYVGLGVGWHRFEETTPSLEGADTSSSHLGYHVLAGAEYPIGRWVAIGGEAQWGAVPGAIGDAGVSATFEEEDLGGAAFRVRILVGR